MGAGIPAHADLRARLEDTLGTQYRIERELVGGGMSRVFVAYQTALDRRIVVKLLAPELIGALSIERFRQEVHVTASLQHPCIVPVHEAGEVSGIPFYTMPFVEGESLRGLLARGPVPLDHALSVLRNVASALDHAHTRGIVHRDLKPENILMSGGYAVVTDFGVAKAIRVATHGDQTSLTSVGVALGTPAYMAPEQAAADPHVDHRADLYALGIIGYELLAGAHPFADLAPQQLIAAHMTTPAPRLGAARPDLPVGLSQLVDCLVEKDPLHRPQSAGDVVRVLESLNAGLERVLPKGRKADTAATLLSALSRSRILQVVVTVPVILGLGVAGVFLAKRDDGPRDRLMRPVLVRPFENRTGNPSLGSLGDMAADWVIQGIQRTGLVPLIDARSAAPVRGFQRPLGTTAEPGAVVTGSYYQYGDSLRFVIAVTDPATHSALLTIDPVVGTAAAPTTVLETLNRRISGALVTLYDARLAESFSASTRPPTYDAYLAYMDGLKVFDKNDLPTAADHFLRSFRIDSTFATAGMMAALAFHDTGQPARGDSLFAALESMRPRLGAYDRANLDLFKAFAAGDVSRAAEASREMVRLAPRNQDALAKLQAALVPLRRVREAAEIWKQIDLDRGAFIASSSGYVQYARVLHLIPDYPSARRVVRAGRKRFPDDPFLIVEALKVEATLGDSASIAPLLDTLETVRETEEELEGGREILVWELRAHGHPWAADRLFSRLRPGKPEAKWEDRRDFYLAGRFEEVRPVIETLAAAQPDSMIPQAYLGVLEARRGRRAEARAIAARLPQLHERPNGSGTTELWQARIAGALGDRNEALRKLRQAFAEGFLPDYFVHTIPDFDSLRGSREFELLLVPR